MWIYAMVFLLVCETWSMDPGTNQSTSVNSSTAKQPKVYVAINLTFNVGTNVKLNCSNKTGKDMIYEIWEIQLQRENCKIAFNTDGRSENNCSNGKKLQNTSESQSYLHIPDFSAEDQGSYRCESVYSGGADSFFYTVSVTDPGSTNDSTNGRVNVPERDFAWLYILIGVVAALLVVGFFIFAPTKLIMLRRCCQADNSTLKTSPTEDVEEVEPYASYVQRVNSIYNSSADFFSPKHPTHASHA